MRYLSMVILALILPLTTPAFADEPAPDATVTAPEVVAGPVVVEPGPVADVVEPAPAEDVATPADAAVTPADDVVTPPAPTPEPPAPPAVTVPTTDEEAGTILGLLLDAAKGGHWMVFGGLVLLFLIWLFNRLGLAAKVGRDLVPWVTVGVGALGCIGIALASGGSILDALKAGLLEGGVAIALWELIFKRFTATKTDGTPRVVPTE